MALSKQEQNLHKLQNLSQRQNRSSKGIYSGFSLFLEILFHGKGSGDFTMLTMPCPQKLQRAIAESCSHAHNYRLPITGTKRNYTRHSKVSRVLSALRLGTNPEQYI